MADKVYSTTCARNKVVLTKSNRKEMNRVLFYLSKGDGAEAPQPKGCIVNPEEYYATQKISALPEGEKFDAILVISKDSHLMTENFPPDVPIYIVTMRTNHDSVAREGVRGVLRVPCIRPKCLIEQASLLLQEFLPERLGRKNIAVYCDVPLLAAQMLESKHRLFIAEHKMPIKNLNDYEYALRAFVTSVVESREQRGRAIGDALWYRPSLRDGAMRAVIKKFGRLLDENDLKIMGFEAEFIEDIINKR